jgi:hypothetical protein
VPRNAKNIPYSIIDRILMVPEVDTKIATMSNNNNCIAKRQLFRIHQFFKKFDAHLVLLNTLLCLLDL